MMSRFVGPKGSFHRHLILTANTFRRSLNFFVLHPNRVLELGLYPSGESNPWVKLLRWIGLNVPVVSWIFWIDGFQPFFEFFGFLDFFLNPGSYG